jgi:hypothetical protein
VTNGLNGTLSAGSFAVDTAIGAVGGAVAGQVVPYAFKSFVPNSIKGDIGEGLSAAAIMLQGDTIAERNAANGIGKSSYDFLLGDGTYVESKFGTSQLSGPQRAAQTLPGNDLTVHYWDYPTVSGILGSGPAAGLAGSAGSPK